MYGICTSLSHCCLKAILSWSVLVCLRRFVSCQTCTFLVHETTCWHFIKTLSHTHTHTHAHTHTHTHTHTHSLTHTHTRTRAYTNTLCEYRDSYFIHTHSRDSIPCFKNISFCFLNFESVSLAHTQKTTAYSHY